MYTSVRPFATAGVALVGASAIAIAPLAVTPSLPDIKIANPAVELSAAVDPITSWLEVFNTSEVNFAGLVNTWLDAPAPITQQVIANQLRYLSELPAFETIADQIGTNLEAALTTLFAEDLSTLSPVHRDVYPILLEGIPPIFPPAVPAELAPLIQFSTSYLSGVLLGLVGPVIAPVLALAASGGAIVDNLTGEAPDLEAAFNTLVNTPAAMADAFLNGGQSIDITPLLTAVGVESPLPGLDFGARLVFGGLLSPGGSIFNAMSIDLGDGSGPIGVGPGAIGSLIGLSQAIAKAIGWDGVGNPLAPPANPPALREADDASVPASKTVTVETSTKALTAGDATVEPTATSTTEASGQSDSLATGTEDGTTDQKGEAAESSTPVEAAVPTEAEEEAGTPTKKPGVKRNDLGSRINGAIKSATDRLNDIGKNFGKRPKKSSETKPSQGADSKTDTKTSDTKTSDSKTSDSKASDSSAA
jgi:hypothetical protein